MDAQTVFVLAFDFGTSKPVVVEPSAAQVSSDAGLLAFRQLDEQLELTEQFAECLTDRRHVGYVGHTFLEMVRMRHVIELPLPEDERQEVMLAA